MIEKIQVSFWLPPLMLDAVRLRLMEVEKGSIENLLPKYAYPLHKIFNEKLNRRKEYNENGVRLNTHVLAEAVAYNNPSKILNRLIEWGFIRRTQGYVSGVKSYSYKLAEEWENSKISRIPIASKRYNDFIFKLKHHNRTSVKRFPIVKYQRDILENHIRLTYSGKAYLRYKYPTLSTAIDMYPENISQVNNIATTFDQVDILLLKFLFGEYFIKRDNESRLYSNLTSLKTEFRQFIQMDGQRIINTDLTNSQVLFGCFVIEDYLKRKHKNHLPTDFIAFKKLSTKGEIYEYIAEKAGLTNNLKNDRKSFKQKFFAEVWFSRIHTKRTPKLYKVFQREFPTVAETINEIKKADYAKFPVDLQKQEAKMMLDIIGIQLKKLKIKFLTIHDSFVLNNVGDLKRAETLISDYFLREYGVEPHFKNDYEEIVNIKTLPYHKRFTPTPLYMHNEREYEINVKCGYAKYA